MIPDSTADAGAARTILVADDTAFVRERFTSAIETAGHRAVVAQSAAEVLAHLRDEPGVFDLVVLDLQLPHANGLDLVRSIRKLGGRRVPIVVFSGTIGAAEQVRDLALLGVAGYINEYSALQHIVPSLAPHLFPDSFNRRASPRVAIGIPIAYRVENTIAAAVTLNVSRGGLAIRTTTPRADGTGLRVRLRLPGARREIDVEARVVWNDRRLGMGLQLGTIDAADQAILDGFVDAHFFSNRKA